LIASVARDMGHDPFSPLGPESQATPDGGTQSPRRSGVPAQTDLDPIAQPRSRASRFESEVERLRRSPTPTFSQSSAGVPWMGIFSRTRDIIAANFTDLLEKADDPEKMIRMIIFEMEETLVEVRASAARTIADQKEMHRHTVKLDRLQADWGDKAQLALSKDREDLARAALIEKKKAADMADQLKAKSPYSTMRCAPMSSTSKSCRTVCAKPGPARVRSPRGWKAPKTASNCARCWPASGLTRRWPGSTSWNAGSTMPKAVPMHCRSPMAAASRAWPTRSTRSPGPIRSTKNSKK
jgi:hypothetical protein